MSGPLYPTIEILERNIRLVYAGRDKPLDRPRAEIIVEVGIAQAIEKLIGKMDGDELCEWYAEKLEILSREIRHKLKESPKIRLRPLNNCRLGSGG